MPKRYEPEDMELIFAELGGESDRAAISVGSSLLENALEKAIETRLRAPKSKKEKDILFTDNGIIGTFYEKIWIAYFLHLIGPQTRRDIDLVRLIRNEVSHNMNPVSFETQEIAGRCRDLELAKLSIPGQTIPPDLRGKFLLTIQFLTGIFLLKANENLLGAKEALEILQPYIDR